VLPSQRGADDEDAPECLWGRHASGPWSGSLRGSRGRRRLPKAAGGEDDGRDC
jgi:hypothetical protein